MTENEEFIKIMREVKSNLNTEYVGHVNTKWVRQYIEQSVKENLLRWTYSHSNYIASKLAFKCIVDEYNPSRVTIEPDNEYTLQLTHANAAALGIMRY